MVFESVRKTLEEVAEVEDLDKEEKEIQVCFSAWIEILPMKRMPLFLNKVLIFIEPF